MPIPLNDPDLKYDIDSRLTQFEDRVKSQLEWYQEELRRLTEANKAANEPKPFIIAAGEIESDDAGAKASEAAMDPAATGVCETEAEVSRACAAGVEAGSPPGAPDRLLSRSCASCRISGLPEYVASGTAEEMAGETKL